LVFGQIAVWLDWQLLTIVLPFVMVILVIVLGEILFRNRRRRIRSPETLKRQQDVPITPVQIRAEETPVQPTPSEESDEGLLKKLQTEIEEASRLYSSGQLSKEEFYAVVHRVENELQEIRDRAPPSEAPKTRRCVHCQEEIPLEAVYCDRCGRYIGASQP